MAIESERSATSHSPSKDYLRGNRPGGGLLSRRTKAWTRASAALLTLASFAHAQFSIQWSTSDGGGGTSTGGVYSVTGTLGQPDAGAMSGGPYALAGGFWSAVNVVQTPGAPFLNIQPLDGGSVRLFWPLPAPGFVLDQTAALVPPPATNVWSQVPPPYQTNATHISVTIAPGAGGFYRLRHP